ncbi:DUF4105 domain-containing protein [Rhodanobacter sp. AS-Z3]|uniref:Lnb N-terminal periplasmic domain-containing protein n=1 Tax=Rhodanobacter sp. AS-Z3 TaxID=3031330 RepID=UPI002478D537|nr:DUF4105 domain-containing protein [Rhodanobacter sp. AS-Z3]WEN14796.1 DUF4105 domain-containing protein [Rhodanobacter sp. AS-Z3]
MSKHASMIGQMILIGLAGMVTLCSGAWGALALWYQLPGGKVVKNLGSVSWSLLVIALVGIAIYRHSWLPLGIYLLLYALLLLWWGRIAPTNRRDWADDVSRPLTGRVEGNQIVLDNVRNFTWRSNVDYDAHWETRRYDLDHIASADAVLSYWSSKAIAHAMISFGFDDGSHVVFSVEIRRKRDQQYSPIGGFFKQFETTLVAADENDIIRVRTNVRGEDDYLYPLRMQLPAMRALFLSYVRAANQLAATPAFYNTISSNCTTLVYHMARQIEPGMRWDIRLLLTGYLPEYLHKLGAVDRSVPLALLRKRCRITEQARRTQPTENFSQAIRQPPPAS